MNVAKEQSRHSLSMGDLWRPNGNQGSQIELLFHNSIFQCWIGGDWSL